MEAQLKGAMTENINEQSENLGIKKYLWLYFFAVPLAAVSASTIAIVIAALSGLQTDPIAPKLYSLIIIVGLKFTAAIALSYLVAVMLSLFTVYVSGFSENKKKKHEKIALQKLAEADVFDKHLTTQPHGAVHDEILEELKQVQNEAHRHLRLSQRNALFNDQIMLATSLLYGAALLAIGSYYYIWPDLKHTWSILIQLANAKL